MSLVPVYQFPTAVSQTIPSLIKVYPNPAKDQLQIETRQNESVTVLLLDLTGKVVLSERVVFSGSLSIGQLPKGIYFLTAGRTREKILKQ